MGLRDSGSPPSPFGIRMILAQHKSLGHFPLDSTKSNMCNNRFVILAGRSITSAGFHPSNPPAPNCPQRSTSGVLVDSEVLSRCTSQRIYLRQEVSGSVHILRKNVASFRTKNFVHLLDVSCQSIVVTFQEGYRRLLDGSEVPVANVTVRCLVQLRLPPTHSFSYDLP